MKQYKKPIIELNSELAEGVYAASGTAGNSGQEQGGVQNPIIPPQGAPDNNGNHYGHENGDNGNHYGQENGNNGNGYGENSGNHYGSSDGNNNGNHFGAGDF